MVFTVVMEHAMREQLEGLLLILAVGAAVAMLARRVSVPYNVALVVVGLLLVLLDVLPRAPLNPEIVLLAILPALVFEGALFASLDHMRQASKPIVMLAVPGVALSLLATAVVATVALKLPFTTALLLGALLAITDTVSVLLAFRSVRVPHRLAAIMEGESLFNDGTALVLVALTTGIVISGHVSWLGVGRDLMLAGVGGVAFGLAAGALGTWVLRQAPDHLTGILASLVLVFTTSVMAERIHASPVIAVVVLGLMLGQAARRTLDPSRVLALEGFWETAGFMLNVVVFLLVGMQIEARVLLQEAPSILLALLALHVGRAVAVYLGFGWLRLLAREPVPYAWQHVMVLGNIKGALSMAAALALPPGLPYRERLIAIVFGVTFVTLLTQALPFKRLLYWLRVVVSPPDVALEDARTALVAARRGMMALDEMLAAGLLSRKQHAERRAAFQSEVVQAEVVLRATEDDIEREVYVTRSLLLAQKAQLLDAAREGVLGEEPVRGYVNRIDEGLLRLRELEEEG